MSEKADDKKGLNISIFDLFFIIGAVGQAGRQKITWKIRDFKSLSGKKNVREKGAGKISGTGMICLGAGVAFYIFEYTQKIGSNTGRNGRSEDLSNHRNLFRRAAADADFWNFDRRDHSIRWI